MEYQYYILTHFKETENGYFYFYIGMADSFEAESENDYPHTSSINID